MAPRLKGKAKNIPENPDSLFLPYQWKWIQDESRMKLMQKGRQIGLSWSTAYRVDLKTAMKGQRYDTWVSSRDDTQARLFLDDCKHFASNVLSIAAKDLGESVYLDSNKKPYTSHEISFDNGRRIHSMSSNPDAQAGKRGTRVLDEFALHPDPRQLYTIAEPGITWGGQMEIISTHRGSQNFFNLLVQEVLEGGNPKEISLHTVTLQDALDQGFLWKLQKVLLESGATEDDILDMDEALYFDYIRNRAADEETFLQEYMCQPCDDASAFLSYEDIAACQYPFNTAWETDLLDSKNPLYVGVDIGRTNDLTVIVVLEKIGRVYHTRKLITLRNTPFSEQEAILYPLIAMPQVRRCCIDETGMGRQFAERSTERFAHKSEGVTFSQASKEEMGYDLRAHFEDRTILIPNDTKGEIVADLRSVKKDTTSSGKIRLRAESDASGHADRFWGIALAAHAGKTSKEFGKAIRADQSRFQRSADRRNRSVFSRVFGGLRGSGRSVH